MAEESCIAANSFDEVEHKITRRALSPNSDARKPREALPWKRARALVRSREVWAKEHEERAHERNQCREADAHISTGYDRIKKPMQVGNTP